MSLEPSRKEVKQARIARESVRLEFGSFFEDASAILFEVDPIDLNFSAITDEYDSEVGTILPRLKTCNSLLDARRVIHEEFARWFDPKTAGEEAHYQQAAERLWSAWQDYLRGTQIRGADN
jgi:hypothetical protein